jgi:hypothetical protein
MTACKKFAFPCRIIYFFLKRSVLFHEAIVWLCTTNENGIKKIPGKKMILFILKRYN